jgi:hypothetical protein
MKVQEKLFILTGADIKKLYNNRKKADCFIAKEALEKFADIIEFGDQEFGFNHTDLSANLSQYITPEDQQINIILLAHGIVKNSTYYISTSGKYRDPQLVEKKVKNFRHNNPEISEQCLENYRLSISVEAQPIQAEELIKTFTSFSGGRPLKIFAPCCFGENLLNFVDLLPPGSFIITLSNRDTITSFFSFCNGETETMLNNLFSNGFKIEYLIKAFLLNQYFQQNTPNIGIKTLDGKSMTIDLANYAQSLDLPKDHKFSSTFTDFLHRNGDVEHDIINKLPLLKNINDCKMSLDDYNKIINFRDGISCTYKPDQIVELIAKYYPYLSREIIEQHVQLSEKDELTLETFIKINPCPLYSLKVTDSFDPYYEDKPDNRPTCVPIFNMLLALVGDVLVTENFITSLVSSNLELSLAGDDTFAHNSNIN